MGSLCKVPGIVSLSVQYCSMFTVFKTYSFNLKCGELKDTPCFKPNFLIQYVLTLKQEICVRISYIKWSDYM